MDQNKILGGLYGALIGDAVGVPYEFKAPRKLPAFEFIDMVPPANFDRTWAQVPTGTYSDDGAQMLCMVECLIENNRSATSLHAKLNEWLHNGHMSVNRITFDVGMQTMSALRVSPAEVIAALSDNKYSGNGSLMRTLPVAMFATTPETIIDQAVEFSRATHPSPNAQVCCAVYCVIAHYLLMGHGISDAIDRAFVDVTQHRPEYLDTITYIRNYEHFELSGTGFVVDSLWSALYAVIQSSTYADVIKTAIKYGNDTDTTACIAGGLAGIIYGLEGIPEHWMVGLRGSEIIEPLVRTYLNK